ncbi:hypothetical protein ONS95_006087 [Cadophora gregata]|uniref:uncharacterized protein n=1 Tax=Cadophora gregata TaxID=51156 RepID=UPI0026DC8E13|nr:uncharacterized protein ONS95_006087 [Cadophora gregata]KAK0102468.1 hypothetical protein ONS95_006087 [Cadophora gregata]KAK0104096.1 hypothetical protein ONS96_005196 [Cadophora gregata f. sp. sojae]
MRGGVGFPSNSTPSQGLTRMLWQKQMNLKLRHTREVSERKQVGDAESMINEGRGASGHHGFFKGDGGEV